MNVLVLGGTRFLGRHLVECFARRGDRVVCFHRGQTTCPLPPEVEERLGDRNDDLGSVSSETWDAIVDTSGYRPEQMQRSLELRTGRYLFISTVNVYGDLSRGGVSEEERTIETFDPTDVAASYGGNKAACERMLVERHPERHVILRPGLIVGRWDPTGRFTYWCERFLRGGNVLAPGAPERRVQFVDAADLARFAARLFDHERGGIFNVAGPTPPATMGSLIAACALVAAERGAPSARIAWADGAFLAEHGIEEWMEMPLWLEDPQFVGILDIDNRKALTAGLETRTMPETVRAALDWPRPDASTLKVGLSAVREAQLLASLQMAATRPSVRESAQQSGDSRS